MYMSSSGSAVHEENNFNRCHTNQHRSTWGEGLLFVLVYIIYTFVVASLFWFV